MKRQKSKILAVIRIIIAANLILMLIMPSAPSVSALVGKKSGFTVPTLSGNSAVDVVSVAKANLGKTYSDYGYTSDWCAWFATDCASIAGVPTSIVPSFGSTTKFYEDMVNKRGATIIKRYSPTENKVYSNPKPGDYIMFRWDQKGYTDGKGLSDPMDHIAIVTAYNSSTKKVTYIGGNQDGDTNSSSYYKTSKVSQATLTVTDKNIARIIRPAYSTSPVPYTDIPEKTYYIKNSSTNTYINASSTTNGGAVSLAAKQTTNAFKMKIAGKNYGGYYITPAVSTDYVLNPWTDSPADGDKITMYKKNTDGHQNWKFEKSGSGYIIHCAYNENVVLTAVGTGIQLKTRTGAANQIWILEDDVTLSSVSIATPATYTIYPAGAKLDTSGLTLTLKYSDDSTKNITEGFSASADLSATGKTKATVSYGGKTVTYNVEVKNYFDGNGTEESPYLIRSKSDLFTLASVINNVEIYSSYKQAYYKQTVDIDLENTLWTPIGLGFDGEDGTGAYNSTTKMFFGIYDGNQHSIYNLNSGKYNATGLFGSVKSKNAEVKNLVVFGTINSNSDCGGITGGLHYGAKITNCAFIGNINGTAAKGSVGGITGYTNGGATISNCYHNGEIIGGNETAGIVGNVTFNQWADNNAATVVENCYHVNGNLSGVKTGAIVGNCTYYEGKNNTVTIKNCYASKSSNYAERNEAATYDDTMLLPVSLLKEIAEDLGEAYIDNTNPELNNGYPVFEWQIILRGDANNDGEVNVADAVMLQKWILGSGDLTNWQNVDLCEDGVIDVFDMVLMRKLIIEK